MALLSRFSSVRIKIFFILVILIYYTNAVDFTTDTTDSSMTSSDTSISSTTSSITSISTATSSTTSISTATSSITSISTATSSTTSISTATSSTTSISTATSSITSTSSTTSSITATASSTDVMTTESSTSVMTNTYSEEPLTSTGTPNNTTTTPTDSKACYPNQFPFGDGCISPEESAGVVITAFVLSLVSFVGALGGFSYMLFRKYFRGRGSRMRSNNDVELGRVSSRQANGSSRARKSNLYDEPEPSNNQAAASSNGKQPRKSAAAKPRIEITMDDAF